MNWIRYWFLRLIGADACPPNCPLCAVGKKQETHYDACAICQGPGFPCEVMTGFDAEEDAATRAVFPELYENESRTASSVPVQILPPWDLSK